MNTYTLQEIDQLVGIINERQSWYDWRDTLKKVKEDFTDPHDIIVDFLCYLVGFMPQEYQDFVFEVPIQEMPLYLNDDSPMKACVSRGRLQIDK
jgi:hypothetical protein